MAKFTSGAKFTYFNILICIAAVLVISYILGYTNITFQTKEGMKKAGGVDPLLWPLIIFFILVGLNFIYQTFKEGVKEPLEYFNILKGV
jgi:uncharacterized membrane protein